MQATVFAGYADRNASLFRRLRVPLGDPAAWVQLPGQTIALVRDLEMDRVTQLSSCQAVTCPAQHAPDGGLSADRETATAQALAEMLCRHGVNRVQVDRTLPYIYADAMTSRGLSLQFDADLGVTDRRAKSEQEVEALAESQRVTEQVMRQVCETIAAARADATGQLVDDDGPLTSERLKSMAAIEFLRHGYTSDHGSIVASTPEVADCHHSGTGPLKTGQTIVVDLFPRSQKTRYWGDCTRTVVHGEASQEAAKMHAAVVRAKQACEAMLITGNLAGDAHRASEIELVRSGYEPSRGTITDQASIQHGTGHGIGLDLHEPILLDEGGPALVLGEVLTVEPGLYGRLVGGVRVEDMVVVTDDGPRNLNRLPQGLDWRAS
ncbi:MAG: M24 family metallopeptidase [Planctomycetota bacterium]